MDETNISTREDRHTSGLDRNEFRVGVLGLASSLLAFKLKLPVSRSKVEVKAGLLLVKLVFSFLKLFCACTLVWANGLEYFAGGSGCRAPEECCLLNLVCFASIPPYKSD